MSNGENLWEKLEHVNRRINAWETNVDRLEDDTEMARDALAEEIDTMKRTIEMMWDALISMGANLPMMPPR